MIKENQNLLNKINIFTDILIVFLSMIFAYLIRFHIFSSDTDYIKLVTYIQFTALIMPIAIVVNIFFNLYHSFRTRAFIKECTQIIQSNTVLTAILLSSLFIFKLVDLSRFVIVIFYFVNITLIILKRFILRKTLSIFRIKGLNLKHVIIVGGGAVANEYLEVIKTNKNYGYNYSGYVANSSDFTDEKLGNYDDLFEVLTKYKPDEVVCALDISDSKFLENIVSDCEKKWNKKFL